MTDGWVAVATTVSALGTVVLGWAAFRLSRVSATNAALRAIGDLANTLTRLRVDAPEVVRRARSWQAADWDAVYQTRAGEPADLAIRYYGYVEIGLEFCNATLAAKADGIISESRIDAHYGRLIDLFITENWPIISQMSSGPYLSAFIQQRIADGPRSGRTWEEGHAGLLAPQQPAAKP